MDKLKNEEADLKQRSKTNWLRFGDSRPSFSVLPPRLEGPGTLGEGRVVITRKELEAKSNA